MLSETINPASENRASRRGSLLARLARRLPWATLFAAGCVALFVFESPERHYRRAVAALDNDRLEGAAYELLGLKDNPAFEAEAELLWGTLLLARGEPKAAMLEAAVAAAHPRTHARATVLLGECLYKSGQFLEAGETWSKLLAEDPDNVDAHRWLGAAYYELGAVREALSHLRKAAELSPQDPGPHRLIGLISVEFWEPKTAIEAYQEALRRAPHRSDNDEIRFALAKIFYRTNRQQEARELLSQCAPTANIVALMADCEYALGNTDRAWAMANDALQLDGEQIRALGLKGKLLIERREFDEAVKTLETAARLAPKDTAVLYDLSIAYRRAGDTEKSDAVHQLVDRLHELQRSYEDMIFKAVDVPRDGAIRHQLGVLAAQLDRPELAHKWLLAAVRLEPGNAQAQADLRAIEQGMRE